MVKTKKKSEKILQNQGKIREFHGIKKLGTLLLQDQTQPAVILTSLPGLLVIKHTHRPVATKTYKSVKSLKSMMTLHLAELCSITVTPVVDRPP